MVTFCYFLIIFLNEKSYFLSFFCPEHHWQMGVASGESCPPQAGGELESRIKSYSSPQYATIYNNKNDEKTFWKKIFILKAGNLF